jgi:hypothetical protein
MGVRLVSVLIIASSPRSVSETQVDTQDPLRWGGVHHPTIRLGHQPSLSRARIQRERITANPGRDIPQTQGIHYHDLADPAWFGLQDFKVLLLEKPGGAPKAQFTEQHGYRWYSQK